MGQVEEYLSEKLKNGSIHLTLIDPEKTGGDVASTICKSAEEAGTSAILVGGSTLVASEQLDDTVKNVKASVGIPVILFPNNISGISRFADAIFFMSLLNSSSTYFLIDAQALGAPLVRKYGLEAIPVGYLVLGGGTTVGFVGQARPMPLTKGELAGAYALAAQYLGMHFIYLEAGSGAPEPVPPKTIAIVKKLTDIPIIVGGGIKTGEDARRVVKAGADVVVTGTVVEEAENVGEKIGEIVSAIEESSQR